jgi:membrane protease YdiL (CAAX protease family)
MATISARVATRQATSYVVLTFAISWGLALVAIGGGGAIQGTDAASDPRFAYAVLAMLVGPTTAGLLMTALVYGRTGLRSFVVRLRTWRADRQTYVIALLTAPVVMTTTLMALTIADAAFTPGIVATDDRASVLMVAVAVGVSAGVFEEIGWTGFAIPALRRRHGVLATGLILGVWCSAWHLLPNVWAMQSASGEAGVAVYLAATAAGVFVGYLTAFRVLMVWVYERTQSVAIAMLMHASLTTSLLTLNPLAISGSRLFVFSFAFAAAMWIVVAIINSQSAILNRFAISDRRFSMH